MVYLQEIVYAARSLRRTAGFSLISSSILALGIAANTIVFTVINAAMLQPLPYPKPEQLVVLNLYSSGQLLNTNMPASMYLLLQERLKSFAGLAAIRGKGVNLNASGKPQYVTGLRVSAGFFRTFDVDPALGRSFTSEEDRPGGPQLVVISYRLWLQAFDRDTAVLGRAVHINGEPYTVVGVMPAQFRSYPDADLWTPLQLAPGTADPGYEYLAIARLREGIRAEDAQRELDHFQDYRATIPHDSPVEQLRLVVTDFRALTVFGVSNGLVLLFAAVSFVLLITCINLAVLFTVRSASRIREVAIRLALGASRARLMRIFLMESLSIALVGGTTGAILAKEVLPFVLRLAPSDFWFIHSIDLDRRVLLFAAAVSVLTAFLFGLAPGLGMSRANLNELLRQSTSNATSGSRLAHLGWILASAQAALTIVLIAGAGSLLRSFIDSQSALPGFNPQHLWSMQLSMASNRYKTTSATAQFLDQLCEKISNQPGIEAAASITGLPTQPGVNVSLQRTDAPEKRVYSQYRIISPEYFQAMSISVLEGRSFTFQDSQQAAHVAIINQTLAKQWFGNQSSLGHYVATDPAMEGKFADFSRQIIGVVNDVHDDGLAVPPRPTMFVPVEQLPDGLTELANRYFHVSIVVRTQDGSFPENLARNLLNVADPDLPIASIRPLSEMLSGSLAKQRFYTYLITGFGVFAMALTAIGLYGLLSYQIVLRTREIAIRMAVGAPRSEVVVVAVKRGVGLVLLGSLVGALAVPVEMKLLASMLYNVRSATPLILISAIFALMVVAALSSLVSTVRAASIEPAMILGVE